MPEQKLKALVEEIRSVVADDAPNREQLQKVERGVKTYLEASDRERHTPALVGELREAAEHFEVSHPALTDLLNQVMNMLSNMGI